MERDSGGRFVKGHPGFKKPGPEVQRATREKLWKFFNEKIDELPAIFDKLSDNQKARLLLETAQFFLPKQRELLVEMEDLNPGRIDYNRLSEEALQEILDATEAK